MPITKASSSAVAPGAKGELVVGSATNDSAILPVGTTNQTILADSTQTTGIKWAASPQSLMTATGDTLYASAANTPARLAVGTTGQVLTVAGGVPTWATAGGSLNWTLLNAGGTALSGSTSTTISGINHDNILIVIYDATCGSTRQQFNIRFNSVSDYMVVGYRLRYNSTYASAFSTAERSSAATSIPFVETSTNAASNASGYCYITGGKGTARKGYWSNGALGSPTNDGEFYQVGGMSATMAAVTSVTFRNSEANNFSGGTIYVYGA